MRSIEYSVRTLVVVMIGLPIGEAYSKVIRASPSLTTEVE